MASESMYAPSSGLSAQNGHEAGLGEDGAVPPNLHLKKKLLYISGILQSTTDKELANVFEKCLPVRLNIKRDGNDSAQTTGTVEFQDFPKAEKAYATLRPVPLALSMNESGEDPKPAARPRLVKQLPPIDDAKLFDLFRPFGPLASARCILTNPLGQYTGFRGMAVIEYWDEENAQDAEREMHCADVDGKTIAISIYQPRRPSGQEFSPSATPFVPGGMNANAPPFSPPLGSQASIHALPPGHPQQGPTVPVPGTNLQYSPAAATYVDPCNLFCKNLDPNLTSNDLFAAFKSFGTIVSARVMRDSNGNSREFGFVSFHQAEHAARALRAMNGTLLGNRQVTIRLHEPKKMRQEKLAQKFGSSSDTNGGRSPSGEEANSSECSSPSGTPPPGSTKSSRRASNTYFKSAVVNSSESVPDAEYLSATPAVQKEAMGRQLSSDASSIAPSVAGSGSERDRLHAAVAREAPGSQVEEITELLVSLPKRERALCLFNPEVLRAKIAEAREVLEITGEDDERASVPPPSVKAVKAEPKAEPSSSPSAPSERPPSPGASQPHTLSSLAKLPAAEIIKLASRPQPTSGPGLPLPKADPAVVRETDAFVDSLEGKPPHEQKQKLGEKLFKVVKSFGVKPAPKITISLLDSEDLRALAHLMNEYPEALKEKVLLGLQK